VSYAIAQNLGFKGVCDFGYSICSKLGEKSEIRYDFLLKKIKDTGTSRAHCSID
jgi:hypothetical protein